MNLSLRAGLLLISPCALLASNATSIPQGNSPKFALTIGGGGASYLLGYENNTVTPIFTSGKQPPPKPGSVTIEAGSSMSPRFYQWIGKALANQAQGGPISIDTLGSNNKITTELKIEHPKLETITIPELNSGSREMGSLRIKLIPGGAAMVTPPLTPLAIEPSGAIQWGKSSFKLSIPGVNCSHVTKIGSLKINPAKPDPKNLTVTISGDQMMDFLQWKGSKSGTIQVAGNGGNLFEIDLTGLKVTNYSGLKGATVTLSCTQVLIRFAL